MNSYLDRELTTTFFVGEKMVFGKFLIIHRDLEMESIITTETKGEYGHDASKKVKGRNRHVLVNTVELVLIVVVHVASIQDHDGAKNVLKKAKELFPELKFI